MEDEKKIKDKALKATQLREKRLEEMLNGLQSEVLVDTDAAVREHDAKKHRLKAKVYNAWDSDVSQRVENQLQQFMMHSPPEPRGDGWREDLRKSDCPIKRELRVQAEEDKFHRMAEAVINMPASITKDSLQAYMKKRDHHEALVASRTTSRPVLPPEKWPQPHHDSPYGYFSQVSERESGAYTARRLGRDAHRPDESDGIPAAGKSKKRFERNLLGMLAGDLAREGESVQFWREHGASSGAPCQDHYCFERGPAIVDEEFPLGKRCFPELHA